MFGRKSPSDGTDARVSLRVRAAVILARPTWCQRDTVTRRLNLYLSRWEHHRRRIRLRSMPHVLCVEPTNACNLRCPFCFTGAGGIGRPRSVMSMALFRALLDEIGDYLYYVKAYNWGEPMLCPHLAEMIALAHARGIATLVTSNLSLAAFDAVAAERLVASGLTELIVSIDGGTQATYERYRVGGDLDRVVANCRLLAAAKRRLQRDTPRLTIEFHPFPWNADQLPRMRALATELGMGLLVFKGCVPGTDWDVDNSWNHCGDPQALPCAYLWTTAVVAADGGVAPCNGTFYSGDDMGHLDPSDLATQPFRAIWNNDRYRLARRFYRDRDGSAVEREHVCFDCPNTVLWEQRQQHVQRYGATVPFVSDLSSNDIWNYFWRRRPENAQRRHTG